MQEFGIQVMVRLSTMLAEMRERSQRGQGMVEYGLILAGIAVVVAAAIFLLGPKIGDMFNSVGNSLSNTAG